MLFALIAVTVIVYFTGSGRDQIDIDRSLFAYEEPALIDRVVFETNGDKTEIVFDGSSWKVNGKYKADPQRVKVLFAIIKQVRVRRPAARQLQDSLQNAMASDGTLVTFIQEGQPVHKVEVLGNDKNGITYMSEADDEEVYLTEIPGYRSYLAGIFTVDGNGWRDPLIFDVNWRNMQQVSLLFPKTPQSDFDIIYDNRQYQIAQLAKTDTTKLFNVLDDISLLFVNDYLSDAELESYSNQLKDTTATIVVQDVGRNNHTLEVFGEQAEGDVFLVRIDSADYGLLERNKLRPVLRPKRYFELKEKP